MHGQLHELYDSSQTQAADERDAQHRQQLLAMISDKGSQLLQLVHQPGRSLCFRMLAQEWMHVLVTV